MSAGNPLLFRPNPYREHPFAIVGVRADATPATIDQFAAARERMLDAGEQPDPSLQLQPGDCTRAAQLLQDPVMRLAFDLMVHPELMGTSLGNGGKS